MHLHNVFASYKAQQASFSFIPPIGSLLSRHQSTHKSRQKLNQSIATRSEMPISEVVAWSGKSVDQRYILSCTNFTIPMFEPLKKEPCRTDLAQLQRLHFHRNLSWILSHVVKDAALLHCSQATLFFMRRRRSHHCRQLRFSANAPSRVISVQFSRAMMSRSSTSLASTIVVGARGLGIFLMVFPVFGCDLFPFIPMCKQDC